MYKYKIALIKNKKIQRFIFESDDIKKTRDFFNQLFNNNLAIIPVKNIVKPNGISAVISEYILLRDLPKYNKFKPRLLKSVNGSYKLEHQVSNFIIMDTFNIDIEEKFTCFYAKKKDKKTCLDILKKYLIPKMTLPIHLYQIDNKLVFDDVVIFCKNIDDCDRLYAFLYDSLSIQKINRILFSGKASDYIRAQLFKTIESISGLTMNRIYRSKIK